MERTAYDYSPFQVHLSERVLWVIASLLTYPCQCGYRTDVITCPAHVLQGADVTVNIHYHPSDLKIQM